MTTSTIPAAKAALVTALRARPGLAGIQVSRAHPGDGVETETIFLGNVNGRHDIPVMKAGRKPRHEEYAIDVYVEVVGVGSTQQDQDDTEDRAFALLAEIENTLADDPQLGTTFLSHAKAGELNEKTGFGDEGWVVSIRLRVECEARLY